MSNLHQLLKVMVEKGASDLHITVNSPPQLRIDGSLHPLRMPPLTGAEIGMSKILSTIDRRRRRQLRRESRRQVLEIKLKAANTGLERPALPCLPETPRAEDSP